MWLYVSQAQVCHYDNLTCYQDNDLKTYCYNSIPMSLETKQEVDFIHVSWQPVPSELICGCFYIAMFSPGSSYSYKYFSSFFTTIKKGV